jgi:hypothetical protein
VDYEFGGKQQFGQDSAYFPANVLGPVASGAGPYAPASSPFEVASLGRNGWVVLRFDARIPNQQGADFTVFENVLKNQVTGRLFDEWMIVSVSQDGLTWHTFPYDTTTGEGMAGRTPTAKAPVDYQNPAVSGGDAFDLDSVGLDWARYVRLKDATQYQPPDRLAAELDAVVSIHQKATSRPYSQQQAGSSPSVWASGDSKRAQLRANLPLEQLRLYNLQGQRVFSAQALAAHSSKELPELASGAYILRAHSRAGHIQRKLWIH